MVTITIIGTHSMIIKELYNKFFYYQYDFIYKINGSNDRLRAAISVVLVLSIIYTLNFMFLSSILKVFHINLIFFHFGFFIFVHYWFYIRKKFFLELDRRYCNTKQRNKILGAIFLVLLFVFTFILSLINHELKS